MSKTGIVIMLALLFQGFSARAAGKELLNRSYMQNYYLQGSALLGSGGSYEESGAWVNAVNILSMADQKMSSAPIEMEAISPRTRGTAFHAPMGSSRSARATIRTKVTCCSWRTCLKIFCICLPKNDD